MDLIHVQRARPESSVAQGQKDSRPKQENTAILSIISWPFQRNQPNDINGFYFSKFQPVRVSDLTTTSYRFEGGGIIQIHTSSLMHFSSSGCLSTVGSWAEPPPIFFFFFFHFNPSAVLRFQADHFQATSCCLESSGKIKWNIRNGRGNFRHASIAVVRPTAE